MVDFFSRLMGHAHIDSAPCARMPRGVELHKRMSEMMLMIWNNQYKEVQEFLRVKKDTNPRYALEWANVVLIQSLMTSTTEDRELLIKLFKAAGNIAARVKHSESPCLYMESNKTASSIEVHTANETAPPNPKEAHQSGMTFEEIWKLECDVISADAMLLRAICQLMMNSYLKGGFNLRKAWISYHSLIQRVEKDTEERIPYELKMSIKYGTGTFYVFLSFVPAGFMKLLSFIGFISDRNIGEQYLMEVFNSNTIRSPFAGLVLCTVNLFLPTGLGNAEVALSRTKHILDTMNERCPQNTYFHGYSNFYYRKKGLTDAAVSSIQLAAANAEKVGIVPLLIEYIYADTLFMDLQWESALSQYMKLFDHLAKTKARFSYTGQVVLSIAACYVMLGKDEDAMIWIKKVGTLYNSQSKNDSNAPKFASRVLANPRLLPLTGVYMLYINRDLAHMTKEQGRRVFFELSRVTAGKDFSGTEAEHLHNLFLGVIEKGCGNLDGAKTHLYKILDAEREICTNLMILPFAYYEVGETEYRLNNIDKAKKLFDKGAKIKGDGNETLANRYSIAMRQLKSFNELRK